MRPTAEHSPSRMPTERLRAMAGPRAFLRRVAVVVALGTLAGCTGNADADPSPTTTVGAEPSPSASADAEVEKPERPAAMDRDDAEGAAAAAEYFIELYPYVMATGDTEEFEGMSHEACGFCADALKSLAANEEAGYAYIGGAVSVNILEVFEQDALTGLIPIDVKVSQSTSSTFDESGNQIASAPREVNKSRVEVAKAGSRWVIVEIAPRPESR